MSERAELVEVLETAQRFGFLGPRPVSEQVDHATALAVVLEASGIAPAPFLDLGSGGGIPGFVLASRWTGCDATLLDASQRRAAYLRRTVRSLGWEPRVTVLEGRGEVLARDPALRASFGLVVVRSFGGPSVTAEIGGAFVREGGHLAVSEPAPDIPAGRELPDTERWPGERMAELGLTPLELLRGEGAHVALARRTAVLGDRWPRGVGIPTKRPLW